VNYLIPRLFKCFRYGGLHGHFSQYGEDVFLHKFFRGQKNGFYIDVGAHHPFRLSNTAFLWLMGWNGVNIDASAEAIRLFQLVRPRDLNIHAAIVPSFRAAESPEIEFFSSRDIDNSATCDATLASERGYSHSVKVPCRSLRSVVSDAAQKSDQNFDFLNIDIEGLDEPVLEDIEDWAIKPRVIMVEIYARTIREILLKPTVLNLERQGYSLVERTGHTAIFLKHSM